MNLSILQNADKSQVKFEPYPYIVIHDALPLDLYKELSKTYVSDDYLKSTLNIEEYENNKRYQVSAKDYFYSDGLWEEFIKYHTSQEFFKEVVELFGEDVIKKYHPSLNKKFPNLMKSPVKIRDKSDTSVAIPLDVQPGINSPVTEESSVIGPHVDNKKEIYAGLLYMRLDEDDSEGGDLEIYRHLDDIPLTEKFDRKARPSLDKLELVDTVPYRKNMFALFINSNVSFHGVTPRQITEHNRRLVNIIAEKK